MQWYLNRSYPEYGIELLHREFEVSIDYFIGNPRFLGRGLGSMMLVALLNEIEPNLAPEDRVFCIAHVDARRARDTVHNPRWLRPEFNVY